MIGLGVTLNPEFIIFTGPMFSGKTTHLIARIDRYMYQNKRVAAFKPKMDDRYSVTDIQTHSGASIPAVVVSTGKEILQYLLESDDDYDIIAVDEAFMIENSADALIQLFKLGKTILVSSLEMSASCSHFEEILLMTPWATHIQKFPAVCAVCHKDAYYTQKKVDDSSIIQVGGADLYEPRCWSCHSYIADRND